MLVPKLNIFYDLILFLKIINTFAGNTIWKRERRLEINKKVLQREGEWLVICVSVLVPPLLLVTMPHCQAQ